MNEYRKMRIVLKGMDQHCLLYLNLRELDSKQTLTSAAKGKLGNVLHQFIYNQMFLNLYKS